MILTRLKQITPTLSPAEYKAATYILDNPYAITRQNIQALAANSKSSTGAIMRICKKIGIKGFSELKLLIAEDLSGDQTSEGPYLIPDLEHGDSEARIIEKIISATAQNIQMIPAILDPEAVRSAAEKLLDASRILLIGIGASHIVAEDLYQKLLRIGIYSNCPMDEDLMLLSASCLTKKDVCIAFSYSGETSIIKKAVGEASRKGCFTIAITRYGTSSLTKTADCVLSVPASESTFRQGATLSRIDQLLVVDALYSSILSKMQNGISLISESFNIVRTNADK